MGNPYPAVFTDQNDEGRVVGAVTFTDAGNQPGVIVAYAVPFAFNTPGLLAAIDTGIVLPDGAYVPAHAGNFSVSAAWNGTTPRAMFGSTQADATNAGSNQWGTCNLTQQDFDYDGNAFSLASDSGNGKIIQGGSARLWLGVDDGSGGPAGGTAGTATFLFYAVLPVAP